MQFNTYINIFMIVTAEYKECICRWNYDTPKFQVKSHRSLIFTKNRKKKQKSSKIEIETGSLYRQRCKRTVRTFAYCDETQSAVVRPSSNHRIGQSWSFFVARIGRLRKLAWHIYTPLSINGIQHSALTPVSPLQISIFSSSIFFFFIDSMCCGIWLRATGTGPATVETKVSQCTCVRKVSERSYRSRRRSHGHHTCITHT